MNVYILFGQRRESYPEEYAPEALEIMDEFAYDENGQWLRDKLTEHEATEAFVALKILRIDLGSGSQAHIRSLLLNTPAVTGTVEGVE